MPAQRVTDSNAIFDLECVAQESNIVAKDVPSIRPDFATSPVPSKIYRDNVRAWQLASNSVPTARMEPCRMDKEYDGTCAGPLKICEFQIAQFNPSLYRISSQAVEQGVFRPGWLPSLQRTMRWSLSESRLTPAMNPISKWRSSLAGLVNCRIFICLRPQNN
jgi:hypothetical protein